MESGRAPVLPVSILDRLDRVQTASPPRPVAHVATEGGFSCIELAASFDRI